MADVEIRFEREGVDGIVAVGSYLIDTVKRFGVKIEGECEPENGIHTCAVVVTKGSDNLSPLTGIETEHFERHGRRSNERLAHEAKIIKPGEVTIMTDQKKEESKKAEPAKDRFQEEFEALPLEKKIASLLRMEAVTLGETFAYVVNSPMKVVEKVGDVIAEFGMKIENEARKEARPAETKTDAGKAKKSTPPPKSSTKRTTNTRATKE